MFMKTLRYLSLSLVLLLSNSSPLQSTVKSSEETGTLEKMIVANGNVPKKSARIRATRSLRVGMIAVWGMGMPSGWRNSAVTANQSARPPTSDASAVART